MKGFFDLTPFENINGGRNKKVKNTVRVFTCEDCGLYKNCLSPKMEYTGKGEKKILVVAEAPGKEEDKKAIQLIGKSGQVFRDVLKEYNYDLDRDFWKTNAVICRPKNNKTPTANQVSACRKYLLRTIEKLKPKGIILLGKVAFDSLIAHRLSGRIKKMAFSDFVGDNIPDQEFQTWICVAYHPSYISRKEYDKALSLIWKKQIRRAVRVCKKEFPIHDYKERVTIFETVPGTIEAIKTMKRKSSILAYDYETTGIKPHRDGHKIYSASVADTQNAISFPFFDDVAFLLEWKRFLKSKRVKRVTHHNKFEEQWTKNKGGGYYPDPVYWDTMIGAHCLNNRKRVGLKYLVYRHFGIIGYDADIAKYIEGKRPGEDSKSGNAFNRIGEAPRDKTLLYGGLDSLFTCKLQEIQEKQMSHHIRVGFEFFMRGSSSLLRATENGVRIDQEVLEKNWDRITKKMDRTKKLIFESSEIAKWDGDKKFNINSPLQLKHLLYDILGLECQKETKKESPSVDKEALELIDNPFVKRILNYRKWEKAKGTYLAQYKREVIKGVVHPFYNLYGVVTYRSSSNSPNFQNNPVRDVSIMRMIRSLVIPRQGNRLVAYDYGGIEVAISACYNKDPNLIKYITDPKSDMHRDQACLLYFRDEETCMKEERYEAKNGFVFPSFYGSYYAQTAPDLWNRAKKRPQTTFKNLKDNGIRTYADFEYHVKCIEKDFWENKFPVYNEWKKQTIRDYEKKGYIDLYTGFRCYGPMSRNEVINYRIQGSAFHCLLWLFKALTPIIKRMKNSFTLGQIHDEALFDSHPEDADHIDFLVHEYGTKKIREYWDWIIVPLTIEKERSQINGNWSEMENCGELKGGKYELVSKV